MALERLVMKQSEIGGMASILPPSSMLWKSGTSLMRKKRNGRLRSSRRSLNSKLRERQQGMTLSKMRIPQRTMILTSKLTDKASYRT